MTEAQTTSSPTDADAEPCVVVRGLTKQYPTFDATVTADDGIDLTIEANTTTALTGSSESGKLPLQRRLSLRNLDRSASPQSRSRSAQRLTLVVLSARGSMSADEEGALRGRAVVKSRVAWWVAAAGPRSRSVGVPETGMAFHVMAVTANAAVSGRLIMRIRCSAVIGGSRTPNVVWSRRPS